MKAISPERKTAIVLFNLGGPDRPDAVQPFLKNLFSDPAIIGLPAPLRLWLANIISSKRAPKATEIYAQLGGKSPILENTHAQAEALEHILSGHGQVKVFTAMRYWHPFAKDVAARVKEYAPDQIVLLPLYPQFSTTTTGSSFVDWDKAAKAVGLKVPTRRICCYPTQDAFIAAHAQVIRSHYEQAKRHGTPRILFSAHGLPEKVIRRGDPYQWQVEETTKAVVAILRETQTDTEPLDFVNCYQSRVGPLKWIGPSTEEEIARAGADKKPIVLVPIAFVSEHSETLVELDVEYAELAHSQGVEHYFRVPTLSVSAQFIAALSAICLSQPVGEGLAANTGGRICAKEWNQCLCKNPQG